MEFNILILIQYARNLPFTENVIDTFEHLNILKANLIQCFNKFGLSVFLSAE